MAHEVEGSGIKYDEEELKYDELGPCACYGTKARLWWSLALFKEEFFLVDVVWGY